MTRKRTRGGIEAAASPVSRAPAGVTGRRLAGLLIVLAAAAAGASVGSFLAGASADPVLPAQGREVESQIMALVDRQAERIRQDPGHAELHGEMGLIYEANQMFEEAQRSYRNAVLLDPSNAGWRYHLAVAFHGGARPDQARVVLEDLVKDQPDLAPAWHRLGMILADEGQLDRAEEAYRQALQAAPGSTEGLLGIGDVMLERGDFAGAARVLEQVLEADPTQRAAHYSLGLAYRGLARTEEAALELKLGKNAVPRYMRDPLSDRLGRYIRNVLGQVRVARTLLEAGRPEGAIHYLEQAVEERPGNVDLQSNLGAACLQAGDLDRARAILERAVQANPSHQGARINLGECLGRMGELDRALELFDSTLALAPHSLSAHLNRGRVLIALGRTDEGVEALRQAVAADPTQGRPLLFLGQVLLNQGEVGEGRQLVREAGLLDAGSLETQLGVAQTFLALGEKELAATALATARRIAPGHPALAPLEAQLQGMER